MTPRAFYSIGYRWLRMPCETGHAKNWLSR